MDAASLIAAISPPADSSLVAALFGSFSEQERRFLMGDFKPSTLDGGRFCEAAARIVHHLDSGNLAKSKPVDACMVFVEDSKGQSSHSFPSRDSALQICRVVRSIYKVRSKRGAIHLSPDYTANEMDARLVVENCRWVLAELLRVLWTDDESTLASAVADLIEFNVPLVAMYDGMPFVLRPGIKAADEILLVLLFAGDVGMDRETIGQAVQRPPSTITNNLTRLCSPADRRAYRADGNYRITPLGVSHLRDSKLLRAS